MSFSEEEARSFLAPLTGRTTTFLQDSRRSNILFASTLMGALARAGSTCAVFDLDAFYSSNSDQIFLPSGPQAAERAVIRIPQPGASLEDEFSSLFKAKEKVVVVDSLNTLYHLLSQEDGSSRSRKLAFAAAGLSYFARTNARAAILSMYRREGFTRGGTGRTISSLTEGTVTVEIAGQELIAKNERGPGWPGGRISTRIP